MGQTFDYREDTIGSTLVDLYPNGYNGLTAQGLTLVQFNAAGNVITHDPFNLVPFVTNFGGNTGGTFNPEFYKYWCNKTGYVPITQTQLRMKFADSVTAPFFSIYRHPKNMEITGTIFPEDETQYSTGNIEDNIVELFFDASYDTVGDPHTILAILKSVILQYKKLDSMILVVSKALYHNHSYRLLALY